MARHREEPEHPIKTDYIRGLRAQRKATFNYWANSAFIGGDQWIYVNPQTKRLEEVPDDDRVRATINVMWPNSRTVMSKLLQRELQFEVPPQSADDMAVEGAKVAEAILAATANEHRWEATRESVGWSQWKGGTAALCVDWDPTLGKPTALGDDGRMVPSGDAVVTPLSIAEFVVQPGAPEAEEAYWWIKAQALPPEMVQAMYGLDETPQADATAGLSALESKLLAAHHTGQNGPEADITATPLTLVLTKYERPNPNNEKGGITVVVGGKTVFENNEWPFPFVDWLNLCTCRETIIENTWMGDTAVSAARSVQAAFNNAWSSILEHADLAGNAKLLMPQSALELAMVYNNVPGEQVPYQDGMGHPEWLTPPNLPSWLLNLPSELRAEIDNIMGVHDISRGQSPANIESGYGLAVLAEQDATPLGKMAKSQAEMWGRAASMVLKLYAAKVEEKRTAVVRIPGMPPDTVEWTGKDLAGQTTAIVPLDLVLPRSRAAMMQLAEKALQMGMISTIEEFTRVAELPDERHLISAVRHDVDRARRENHKLALGVEQFAENWDNHADHIREHNNFRKSARYESLSPEVKRLFALHIQQHETLAAEEAGAQQMRLQQGGPMLANAPRADGAEQMVPEEAQSQEMTVLDQLSGDPAAANERELAEAASMGAAVDQQDMERDAILALMEIQGGGQV